MFEDQLIELDVGGLIGKKPPSDPETRRPFIRC